MYSAFVACGTLNSRRATSHLVRFGGGREVRKVLQGALPHNWGGAEPNHTVICMMFKATVNDRRKSAGIRRDEFNVSRSETVKEVSLETATCLGSGKWQR
ncbi:hypothetical protein TNCV_4137891 [Trichonephila clavipes]|nr:hypothetical protein TNCV_4137891 [Trichonephila clavipes]